MLEVVNKLNQPANVVENTCEELDRIVASEASLLPGLADFLRTNPLARPARFHPAVGSAVADVWAELESQQQPSVSKFIEIVGNSLSACFSASWIRFAVCLGKAACDTDLVPQSAVGIFDSIRDVDNFLKIRVHYTLHIFREVLGEGGSGSGQQPIITPEAVSKFCKCCMDPAVMPALVLLDSQLLSLQEWTSAWDRFSTKVTAKGEEACATYCKEAIDDVACEFQKRTMAAVEPKTVVKLEVSGDSASSALVAAEELERADLTSLGDIYNAFDENQEVPSPGAAAAEAPRKLGDVIASSQVHLDALSLQSILMRVQASVFSLAAQWQNENEWVSESLSFQINDQNSISSVVLNNEEGNKLKLHFCGTITMTKSNGSLLVGNIEGLPLYMASNSYDKLTSSCFMPAWAIPEAEESSAANMELKSHAMSVALPKHVQKDPETKVAVVITVPYLQVIESCRGEGTLHLMRAKRHGEPPSKGKGRGKGLGRGGKGKGKADSDTTTAAAADFAKSFGGSAWVGKRGRAGGKAQAAPAAKKGKASDAQSQHLLG